MAKLHHSPVLVIISSSSSSSGSSGPSVVEFVWASISCSAAVSVHLLLLFRFEKNDSCQLKKAGSFP